MVDEPVFYFAYGSNADPDRFRARVGEFRSSFPATLADHGLRFSACVQSEGGGGAVIDARPGESVAGVVFEISAEQLAAMDRVEFDPSRDTSGIGRRKSVMVDTADGRLQAELYYVEDDGSSRAPSKAYLDHILAGLAAAGHSERVLERVRAAARSAGGEG